MTQQTTLSENEIPGPDDLEGEDNKILHRWQVPGTQIVIGRVAEDPQTHPYVFTLVSRFPRWTQNRFLDLAVWR